MISSVIPKLPFIDKQATLNFYTDIGFRLNADYGDYLILSTDKVELHFFSYPTLVPGKSDFMIYMRVDSAIEELYQTYQSIATVTRHLRPLEAKPWGQKEFHIIDPNGTLLTFGQAYSV